MITWGDIKNKDTTVTSTSTSASSSSMSVDRDRSPSPMNVASLSDLLPPNFLSNYPLVSSRPNASTAHNFREHLINRDQVDVYFGKYKSSSCEASHLINGFNPVWVGSTPLYTWENTTNFRPTYNVMQLLDYIAQTRGYTGGESMEAWAKLGSCFEPQLGLLLWQALHFHLDKAQLGILRVHFVLCGNNGDSYLQYACRSLI